MSGLQQEQMQTQVSPTRINWRRLGMRLLATLVLPVLVALVMDWLLATSPILTIVVAVICIPVATFVVMRTALIELDRVIEEVAPSEPAMDGTEIVNIATDDSANDRTVAANDEGNGAPDATN